MATTCVALALAWTWTTSLAQGGELRFGEPLDAVLAPGGVDDWIFSGAEGDVVALRVERTDSDLEPALLVSDAAGQPIAGTRAAPGTGSATLVQVRLPHGGSFVVQVSGAGQTAGAYRLSLDRTQTGPAAATLVPGVAREEAAGTLTPGRSVQGEIGDDVFRQLWTLPGQTGDVVDIRMSALTGDLDAFVALLAPGGDVLVTNDSADGGRDAGLLAFQLPFNGEYTVVARRAGEAAGRTGTTRGTYRLEVAQRAPGDAARSTQLGFGEAVRGRLDDAFPVAVYRLEIGGSLALRLDLGSANRLARLRFLSAAGDVIAERTGLSPLLASARLDGRGPFLVEISAQTFEGAPSIDYAVTAFRLSAAVASARPLDDDAPQTWTAAGPETWFFTAEAGDLARLDVSPQGQTAIAGAVVRVRAPGDVILYQGDLEPGIDQEMILPSAGLYEVEIRPPDGSTVTYRLGLTREGGRGVPFAPFAAAAVDIGPLQPGAPVEATLAPGAVEARWIDASAGQVITLKATAERDSDVIGLGLQRPDGSFVRVQLSQPDRIALIARIELEETGRYRAVVFGDPASMLAPAADAQPIRYTLRYDEAGGGSLHSGAPVKDFVSPEDGLSVWRLVATGGALLNLRAENLTPAVWSPSLTLLAPGGGVVAATSAPSEQGGSTLELLGVEAPVTGTYQVVMTGAVIRGQIASYTLQAEVQEPFVPDVVQRVPVAATRLAADLFETDVSTDPVRVSIPSLLNSPISPTQTGELVHNLPFDTTARGEIGAGQVGQTWRFTVGSGLVLQVRATALTRHAGPSLALWDQNGGLVFEQHSADEPETLMISRLPQGGTYDLVVSMGLEGGRYLIALEALDINVGSLQVQAGAPLVYGQSAAGESLRPGDEATYYFLGAAGDSVRAQLVRTAGNFAPGLELIAPNETILAQSGDGASTAILDAVRLPTTGVYALRTRNLSSAEGGTGRYSLYLTQAGATRLNNRGGGVLKQGETVRGRLGPGDNEDTWLLAGRAGERITLEAVGVDALAPITMRLADTAGRPFAVRETSFAQTPARVTGMLLPADGIYRVQISGGARAEGMYTLTWKPEVTGVEPGPLRYGQTVTGLFASGRLYDTWTFAATAGDVVSIAVRYLRGDPFSGSFQLRSADGLPLATVGDAGDGKGTRADVLLPFSGSYSIVVGNVDPAFQGAGVYALSLNLRESHARSAGTVLRYGQTAAGDIYSDDGEDSWVFGARAGDQVRIVVTPRDRFLRPMVELRSAAGELLAQSTAELDHGDEAAIGASEPDAALVIPADDVYVISVRGAASRLDGHLTTGSYHLALDYTPPPIAAIEQMAYGESRPGLIAADRPREVYVFSAQQGDVISANMIRETGATLSPVIELRDGQGRLLAQSDDGGDGEAILSDVTIPAAGAYRLAATRYLGREGRTAGRYSITLTGTPAPRIIRANIAYDQEATGRLSDENTNDRYTFQASAGDVVRIDAPALSGNLDTVVALESPTGTVLALNDDAAGVDARIEATLLPGDGVYTVVVSRSAGGRTFGRAGNYQLTLTRLYQAQASAAPGASASNGPLTLSYGARTTGALDTLTPEARYVFDGVRNDEIALHVLHQNDDAPPLLSVQDPAGTVLAEGRAEGGRVALERFPLPVSGRYVVVVRRPSNAAQSFSPYALTLDLLSASTQDSASGGLLSADESAVGSFTPAERGNYWLFNGHGGSAAALELVVLSGDIQPSAILIGPDGRALAVTESSNASVRTADVILPADGYYSVLVVAGTDDGIGQYRLTLHTGAALDNSTRIEPGRVFSGLIDLATPEQRLTFDAQAGQVVSARMLVTGGDLAPWLRLVSPDGRTLAEGALTRDGQGVSSVLSPTPLGAPGVYALVASSQDSGTALAPGQGTFRLLMELDSPSGAPTQDAVTARRIAYGQPARGLVQGGERELWAFIGAEGETVNLSARALASGAEGVDGVARQGPALEVQDTGGHALARAVPEGGEGDETAITSLTLPASGRYIVSVSAEAPLSYALVVQQREAPADLNSLPARALVPGGAQQNGIGAESPVNYWRFSADAGEVVQIEATRIDGDVRLDLALYGPNGFVKSATAGPDDPGATLGPLRLADAGAYVLVVNRWLGPAGRTNGSYRIVLSLPDDVSGSEGGAIPAYGRAVTGALTSADPADVWSFRGAAGEVVELRLTRLGGTLRPTLTLYAPGIAAPLSSAQGEGGEAILPRLLLPQDGEYRVAIGGLNGTSGAYTLAVRRVQTPEQSSIATAEGITPGEIVDAALNEATPRRAWVFWGEGGMRVTVDAAPAAGSALDPFLTLVGPDGSTLLSDDNGGGGLAARLSAVLLPANGFYGIVVSASPLHVADGPEDAERFGPFTVRLDPGQPATAHMGRLAVGEQVSATLDPARPSQEWTFSVTGDAPGSTIAASIGSPGVAFAARLFLVTADGRLLGASGASQAGQASVEAPLPGPGDYAVLVVAQTPTAQGEYQLTLSYALAPTGGGVLTDSLDGRGAIADADFSDEWRFTLPGSGSLVIEAARTGGDVDLELALFGPDGALIASQAAEGAESVALAQVGLPPGAYVLIVSRTGGAAGATQGDYRVALGG